jgi:hypothetical protein
MNHRKALLVVLGFVLCVVVGLGWGWALGGAL